MSEHDWTYKVQLRFVVPDHRDDYELIGDLDLHTDLTWVRVRDEKVDDDRVLVVEGQTGAYDLTDDEADEDAENVKSDLEGALQHERFVKSAFWKLESNDVSIEIEVQDD